MPRRIVRWKRTKILTEREKEEKHAERNLQKERNKIHGQIAAKKGSLSRRARVEKTQKDAFGTTRGEGGVPS